MHEERPIHVRLKLTEWFGGLDIRLSHVSLPLITRVYFTSVDFVSKSGLKPHRLRRKSHSARQLRVRKRF